MTQAGRVVLVAIGTTGARGVKDFIDGAVARGYRVEVITDDVGPDDVGPDDIGPDAVGAAAPDRPVHMHLIGPAERRTVLGRLSKGGKVSRRVYNVVRPLVLWRVTRRRLLADLERTPIDRVVVNGTAGVTIGCRLARRHPGVPATTSLSLVFAAAPDPVRSP
jgi:hypothetical protein